MVVGQPKVSSMTYADRLFERFCRERGIALRRLSEGTAKTPDYEIILREVTVAVEVKQLEPNAEDQELLRELRARHTVARYENMGRARQTILDATKQLRAHAKNRMPALAVLYDTMGGLFGYLEGDCIAQCLYGAERIHVAVPTDRRGEPRMLGASLGGRRVATQKHNTTLSAVAVLQFSRSADKLSLSVFHNTYAAMPLKLEQFRASDVRHFVFQAEHPGELERWVLAE